MADLFTEQVDLFNRLDIHQNLLGAYIIVIHLAGLALLSSICF